MNNFYLSPIGVDSPDVKGAGAVLILGIVFGFFFVLIACLFVVILLPAAFLVAALLLKSFCIELPRPIARVFPGVSVIFLIVFAFAARSFLTVSIFAVFLCCSALSFLTVV